MFENSKRLERFARNFILENKISAINRAKALREQEIYSTINNTVEHVDNFSLASSAVMALHDLIFTIKDHGLNSWSSISIKMSSLGMDFDEEFCEENLLSTIKLANALCVDLQFDVEGPQTHDFYFRMVNKYDLNSAIQAKSPPSLFPAKPPRIVKGAYKTKKKYNAEQIKLIMLHFVMHYLAYNNKAIVGTHDSKIISGLPISDKIELQYLHGIKEKDFFNYKVMGFKVREYIPYGNNWYPYLIRRIKEDPWGKLKMALSV